MKFATATMHLTKLLKFTVYTVGAGVVAHSFLVATHKGVVYADQNAKERSANSNDTQFNAIAYKLMIEKKLKAYEDTLNSLSASIAGIKSREAKQYLTYLLNTANNKKQLFKNDLVKINDTDVPQQGSVLNLEQMESQEKSLDDLLSQAKKLLNISSQDMDNPDYEQRIKDLNLPQIESIPPQTPSVPATQERYEQVLPLSEIHRINHQNMHEEDSNTH